MKRVLDVDGFEWDEGNLKKCQKHNVSIAIIETLFASRSLYVAADPAQTENRFRAVGIVEDGRGVFIVFTIRDRAGKRLIRPISARYMHEKELKHYEEEISDF